MIMGPNDISSGSVFKPKTNKLNLNLLKLLWSFKTRVFRRLFQVESESLNVTSQVGKGSHNVALHCAVNC